MSISMCNYVTFANMLEFRMQYRRHMLPYDMFFSQASFMFLRGHNLLFELVFTISQVSSMRISKTDILLVSFLHSGSILD